MYNVKMGNSIKKIVNPPFENVYKIKYDIYYPKCSSPKLKKGQFVKPATYSYGFQNDNNICVYLYYLDNKEWKTTNYFMEVPSNSLISI